MYAGLDKTATMVGDLVSSALSPVGVPYRLQTAGNMFSIFFTDTPVSDYETAKTQDVGAFRAFFHALLAHGVYVPPSSFEAWFVSAAIDDAALEIIAGALPHAAVAAAAARTAAARTAAVRTA
jgi:glutamate-1-semialdehyde 2,1-aminomutase